MSQEWRRLQKLEQQERSYSLEPIGGYNPASTLTCAPNSSFQTSDLCNCETINACSVKTTVFVAICYCSSRKRKLHVNINSIFLWKKAVFSLKISDSQSSDLHFSAKLSRHIILLICDKPQKHTSHQYSDCNVQFKSTQKSSSSFHKSPVGSHVCCLVQFVLNLGILMQIIIYNLTWT